MDGYENMRRKKSGFTLIEMTISMSLVLLLGGIIISSIVASMVYYKENIDRLIYMDQIDNCMLNIDTLCNSNGIKGIRIADKYGNGVEGESIVITYYESYSNKILKDKVIYLANNKLKIKTLKGKDILF